MPSFATLILEPCSTPAGILIVIFFSDIDSPKNLVTEQVTENTATVSWDPVQAVIDRYLVRYTSADGDSREVPVGKEQSSTVLTGLRPGVEYTVHVWAQKGDQESRKADTKAPTGNGALLFRNVSPEMLKSMAGQVLYS